LKFQELINQIYLSKKVINLARVMFCALIEEENFKNNLKHNKFSQRNLKHNYEKLQESKSKCNVNDLTCLTFIEYNKISKKNYIYFTYRQNPKLLTIICDYIEGPSKKNGENNNNHNNNHQNQHHNHQHLHHNHNHEIPDEDKVLIGRHAHICQQLEKQHPDKIIEKKKICLPVLNETNVMQNYIAQSVKDSRESTDISPVSRKQSVKFQMNLTGTVENNNYSRNNSINRRPDVYERVDSSIKKNANGEIEDHHNEFSLNCEERLSEFSAMLSPYCEKKNNYMIKKQSFQSEHSVIFLDENNESHKSEENLDEMYDNFDPDNFNPRESILLLKNKKVYNNINKEVLDKYFIDIEHSESFDFVNKLFAHDIMKK